MEVIACPNCGKLLEYRKGTPNQYPFSINCPKCGNVPLLEDSQVITISDGRLGGPGLVNLEEYGEELSIREGKIEGFELGQEEESVIRVEAPSISTQKTGFKSNVPSATVEEKLDFEWKAESKEVGHPFSPASPSKAMSQTRATPSPITMPSNVAKSKTVREDRPPARPGQPARSGRTPSQPRSSNAQTRRIAKRKFPWHYYALFYGAPALVVLILIGLVVMKLSNRFLKSPRQEIIHVGPHEIWRMAEESYQDAHISYQEAIESREKKDQPSYVQKLDKADLFCKKALDLGQKSWEEQIKLLMEQKKMEKEEAEKYAQNRYGGYQEKMQLWQQEHRTILEELALVRSKPK